MRGPMESGEPVEAHISFLTDTSFLTISDKVTIQTRPAVEDKPVNNIELCNRDAEYVTVKKGRTADPSFSAPSRAEKTPNCRDDVLAHAAHRPHLHHKITNLVYTHQALCVK